MTTPAKAKRPPGRPRKAHPRREMARITIHLPDLVLAWLEQEHGGRVTGAQAVVEAAFWAWLAVSFRTKPPMTASSVRDENEVTT